MLVFDRDGQDRPHDRPPRDRTRASCSRRRRSRSRRPDAVYVADTGNGRIVRFTLNGDAPRLLRALPRDPRDRGVARRQPRLRRPTRAPTASRCSTATGGDLARVRRLRVRAGQLRSPGQIALDARRQPVGRRPRQRPRAGVRARRRAADRVRRARDRRRASSSSRSGIAVDCRGLVTVADSDNNRVQQFQFAPRRAPARALPAVQNPPQPDPADAARAAPAGADGHAGGHQGHLREPPVPAARELRPALPDLGRRPPARPPDAQEGPDAERAGPLHVALAPGRQADRRDRDGRRAPAATGDARAARPDRRRCA